MKKCFKCGIEKSISEFYKHKQMADGHLNKCKDCNKADSKRDHDRKIKDPEWYEKEKERHRGKYHRLGYRDKHKPTYEQKVLRSIRYKEMYPEKLAAKSLSSNLKKIIKSNHNHHWSYNIEHAKDVIELTPTEHALAHRYIIYDQERCMYRTLNGVLLDTKESHIEYISQFINK